MLVRVPALLKLSSPQLQAMVPVAKTQAPLGAWYRDEFETSALPPPSVKGDWERSVRLIAAGAG